MEGSSEVVGWGYEAMGLLLGARFKVRGSSEEQYLLEDGTRGEGLWIRAGEGGDQRGDGSRVDGAGGEGDGGAEGFVAAWRGERNDIGGDENGGSVEQDDVAARARFASKDGAEDGGVGGGIASTQAVDGSGGEADLLRREAAEGDGVAEDFGELGWAGDGEFVDAGAVCGCSVCDGAVDDEGVTHAEQEHGLGDDGDEASGVDAHDLGAGSGGVGQRAEDIERGADAEGTADGHDGLHRRMQTGCVQEGEAVAAQRFGPG